MEAQQGGEKSSDGMERGKCNTLGLLKKKKNTVFSLCYYYVADDRVSL